MNEQSSGIKASFIDRSIHELENSPDSSRHLLAILSSLEKFQKEIQDCKDRDEALAKMLQFIRGWDIFYGTAFYLVNEDYQFDLSHPSDSSLVDPLEQFIRAQIKEGRFAWALQQNREILVDTPSDLPGDQAVFHGMSTRHTTLGMFVGLLKGGSSNIRSSFMRILSIMIDAVVYVYENHNLEAELKEYNLQLEKIVNSRTRELRHSNQHLYQSNAELKKVNEKKSEFLGIVAHDLKNPLSGIIGFSDLIEDELTELNSQTDGKLTNAKDMLKYIGSSARQMVTTLNDLMDSEIIESGHLKLEPVAFDLTELVRKVVAINQTQATSKDIRVHLETESNVLVYADPLRIHEALDNLISNAIKYSPLDREVWVRVFKKRLKSGNDRAIFSVKDEGPGISESDKEKLFGRFQKLSARPTAGESSTGLGLSIAKNLINLHDGEVYVDSKLGEGTTFSIELPFSTRSDLPVSLN